MIYIGPDSSETLGGVGVGTYQVQVMHGGDFSRACGKFMRDASVQVFEQSAMFREMQEEGYVNYSNFTVTLHKVAGGNARNTDVDPSVFAE
jgi:hypothetical protein